MALVYLGIEPSPPAPDGAGDHAEMVSSGHGCGVSDVGTLSPMNLLRLALVWTAASVPVSVIAGAFLAAGGADAPRRTATVPASR